MELRTSCGVSAAMRMRIQQTLRALEEEHQIRILYACESGSRGWDLLQRTVIMMCALFTFIGQNGICELNPAVM